MRYIRTQEGIYEDAGTDALGLRCVRYKGDKIALSQDDDEIFEEANTIGELCDEFVIISREINYYVKDDFVKAKEEVKKLATRVVCYGAI